MATSISRSVMGGEVRPLFLPRSSSKAFPNTSERYTAHQRTSSDVSPLSRRPVPRYAAGNSSSTSLPSQKNSAQRNSASSPMQAQTKEKSPKEGQGDEQNGWQNPPAAPSSLWDTHQSTPEETESPEADLGLDGRSPHYQIASLYPDMLANAPPGHHLVFVPTYVPNTSQLLLVQDAGLRISSRPASRDKSDYFNGTPASQKYSSVRPLSMPVIPVGDHSRRGSMSSLLPADQVSQMYAHRSMSASSLHNSERPLIIKKAPTNEREEPAGVAGEKHEPPSPKKQLAKQQTHGQINKRRKSFFEWLNVKDIRLFRRKQKQQSVPLVPSVDAPPCPPTTEIPPLPRETQRVWVRGHGRFFSFPEESDRETLLATSIESRSKKV